MNQFNHILKNNNNMRVQKKDDKSNEDTTFDLSESSGENDNLSNSFNSQGRNSNRNNSTKKKKRSFKNIINGETKNRENIKNKKNRNKNVTVKTIFEVLEKKKKKFRFLKPFTNIKDEKLSSQLKKYGFDLENILILTNKNDFQSFIDDIITSLGNLINNI